MRLPYMPFRGNHSPPTPPQHRLSDVIRIERAFGDSRWVAKMRDIAELYEEHELAAHADLFDLPASRVTGNRELEYETA